MSEPEPDFLKRCSFCGTDRGSAENLVVGPRVSICNECVATAFKILARLRGDLSNEFLPKEILDMGFMDFLRDQKTDKPINELSVREMFLVFCNAAASGS